MLKTQGLFILSACIKGIETALNNTKDAFCVFAKTHFQRIIIPITAMKRRVHFL